MKLPAVAIAAAFAGGILLGMSHFISSRAAHISFQAIQFAIVLLLVVAGCVSAWRNFVWSPATLALAAWVGLGLLAACLADRPLSAEHVLSRLAAHQIPQKTPLRWQGVLREESSRLPWGYGLEMNLTGVEMAEGYLPVDGGMRLGFTPREGDSRLPELHAGDGISVLAQDFHRISLVGPIANVLVVPLTGVIVPLGFLSLGLASLLPNIASLIAHLLIWLVLVQQRIVSFLAAMVGRLQYRDRTILLPGDAEKQVEYQVLSENDKAFLHADVLKVSHHGSKNSTMPEFLSAVAPQISIISAGEVNPFGHPSPELVERLAASGTQIFRTDQDGAVQVLTDGHTLQVSCFVGCSDRALALAEAQAPDHNQTNQQ